MTSRKYILFGVVTPERALIDMEGKILIKLDQPHSAIKGDMSVSIIKNQIIVNFDTSNSILNWNTLRNIVTEIVSTIVDCAGINSIVGYTVDMRAMYDVQDQTEYVFGAGEYLSEISVGERELRKTDISEMLKVCYLPHIQLALSDFKYAILCPKDTGLFCYRAFESLVHFVMEDQKLGDKKSTIKKLGEIINVDSECFDLLRKLNIQVRHGKPVWISGEDRALALRVSREIILRYLAYLNARPNLTPSYEHYKLSK